MNTYYIVKFNDWSVRYESVSEVIDGIEQVIEKLGEVATEITEYGRNNEPLILYKPQYSAKLIWTDILSKDVY
jgi:hypothetical protein